ncbi:hypothetical protein BS78_02G312000 [Paspalum vaginatum]|nr:hypothetical protein BS78_02G312000 [Paspalum vaginatum]KAJ1291383.1 hypothetical protein BS78_02G312000 [Paspalum vaginatum]KAJ1291384.1 hypothetical protein BS78_02G312000 [Paspalum vaginatum]KAJ1291385.1 hypothetical protein BS78_02G312000 [Paspalum vaginatum]KAJ1291386.1 hypothetical protein BS78_02G312000 [Paspalum vaginatum]
MATPARHPRDAAGTAPIPRELYAAVSTVSTSQILRASGYSAAEPAALRALSDIAGRYIASLGAAAVAFAEARGRTEPNIADVVLALEDHTLGGFPGASDPARPVLCSGTLADLAGFVAAVREVPFAKPLPRRDPGSDASKCWESFAAAGREPPLRHVPQWLPCFPQECEERLRGRGEVAAQVEEVTGQAVTAMVNGNGAENGRRVVPKKREKVSFRLGQKRRQRLTQSLPILHPGRPESNKSSSSHSQDDPTARACAALTPPLDHMLVVPPPPNPLSQPSMSVATMADANDFILPPLWAPPIPHTQAYGGRNV